MKYLLMLRPGQWVKNVLVFAGLGFAGGLFTPKLIDNIWVFVAFCLASSSIYILNDWWDKEEDKTHPIKRKRPIAAGTISPIEAFGFSLFCGIAGSLLAFSVNTNTGLVVFGYMGLQVFYTIKLKEIEFADTLTIASGFVLRAVGGATGAEVPITHWFLICVFFGALLLAMGKRTAEGHDQSEAVLVVAGVTICSYALYATQHKPMLLTLPLVCYGVFRYLSVILSGGGEEPGKEFGDKRLLVCVGLWLLMSLFIYYR